MDEILWIFTVNIKLILKYAFWGVLVVLKVIFDVGSISCSKPLTCSHSNPDLVGLKILVNYLFILFCLYLYNFRGRLKFIVY